MPTFHFSLKSGRPGTASTHAAYIVRDGKFRPKGRPNDLLHAAVGNLPEWAGGSPKKFWATADKSERVNGAAYREYELALPQEFSIKQNIALVEDLVKEQVKAKTFMYAIHSPTAALGGCPQPHVHLMVSDRIPDHIYRTAEQHFRRYNAAHPELGGCKKDTGGKDRVILRNELIEKRRAWAEMTNKHLEQNGYASRVDHRSHEERGINAEPGAHLGPARVRARVKALQDSKHYEGGHARI